MPSEKQHYVPKFLLKGFAAGKKARIWVYDKTNDRRFNTNIKNVAAEKGFYDLEVSDEVLTVEPALAHLEGHASSIIKKLAKQRTLRSLDEHDVGILATFVAIQFLRTKEQRIRFEHIGNLLEERLRQQGATEDNIAELLRSSADVPEEKLVGFRALGSVLEFVPHFLNKVWLLFETTRANPLYISDNPVTLHNEQNHGPYGNIGLSVKGIQIYLPLSTTMSLGVFCPSITEEFETAHRNIQLLDAIAPGQADELMNNPQAARAFCEGLANSTPIPLSEENVTRLNSLQVLYASRFVYCEKDRFELVELMIRDNEACREALRPTLS